MLAAVALVALLLAAAALAAGGIIGIGAPVGRVGGGERASRAAGIGLPVPEPRGHAQVRGGPRSAEVALSVADPAGGLRWGMRIVTTTRGLRCVQIGRVLGDRLGVVGEDGECGNDGLLHELLPRALDQSTCSAAGVRALYVMSGLPTAGMLPGDLLSCGQGPPARAGARREIGGWWLLASSARTRGACPTRPRTGCGRRRRAATTGRT